MKIYNPNKEGLLRILSKYSKHGNGRLNVSINKQDIHIVDAVELSVAPDTMQFLLDFTVNDAPDKTPGIPRAKKFKFSPNKNIYADGQSGGSFTNGERAEHAQAILENHLYEVLNAPADDLIETSEMTDIISDFGHYCDREGHDFLKVLFSGIMNWEAERGKDSDIIIQRIVDL